MIVLFSIPLPRTEADVSKGEKISSTKFDCRYVVKINIEKFSFFHFSFSIVNENAYDSTFFRMVFVLQKEIMMRLC